MRTFGKVIAAIFDGIVKVLSFIFGTLGLWLPALYSVIYLSVCGFKGVPIEGRVGVLFYCGLVLSVVLGFAFSMYLRSVRKAKEPAEDKKKKVKASTASPSVGAEYSVPPGSSASGNGYVSQNKYPMQSNGNVYPQGSYPPPQYNYPPQNMNPSVPPQSGYVQSNQNYYPPQQGTYPQPNNYAQSGGYQPNNYAQGYPQNATYGGATYPQSTPAQPTRPNADLEKKYFSPASEPAPERYERTVSFDNDDAVRRAYGSTEERNRSTEYSLGTDELWRRLTGTDVPDEQPLVFRTRKDPDLYVYEYSDRYQYWRRTKSGMVFEQTEFKKEPSSRK